MGFDALLGNDILKQRLTAALSAHRLSHCYLISGPAGSGKGVLARYLAAAMQCTHSAPPCGLCTQCRKILHGTHPDVITVDEPGKKNIPVKLVRDACADLFIRPNEGVKKIYVFPRAQALNSQGQNALLKCIEEPPPYGAFLLLCEHEEQLLPTIRSRCAVLRMSPLPQDILLSQLRKRFPKATDEALRSAALRSDGYLGQAVALLQENAELLPQTRALSDALCSRRASALLSALVPMEKLKREQLQQILLQLYELLAAALGCQSGLPSMGAECRRLADCRSTAQLLSDADTVKKAVALCDANIGAGHICGMLSIRLNY